MSELNWLQWMIAVAAAFSIGLTKTGIPGLSILFIPLMAECFLAKASTGIVLPLLMLADVFAVAYYRRHAVWPHLLRLMPWTALGVVIGYFALDKISDSQLKPVIGAIILVILLVNFWFESSERVDLFVPKNWWFAVVMGITAGALLGIVFLRRIPEKKFRVIVQALAAIAAIKLFL